MKHSNMSTSPNAPFEIRTGRQTIEVVGTPVEVNVLGTGAPIFILHGAGGPRPDAPFMHEMAKHGRVIAPTHPGFADTERGGHISGIDDLAHLYLDLLDVLDLHDVTLVGFSMGGWTASEMAVHRPHRVKKLVLVDAVGIKTDPGEAPEPPRLFDLTPEENAKRMFFDPKFAPNMAALSEDQQRVAKQNRKTAQLFIGDPLLHNPKLRRRLHRINVPTLLLWGSHDGLVTPAYGEAYRRSIPGARLEIIENAGHTPQTEQPEEFGRRLGAFIAEK